MTKFGEYITTDLDGATLCDWCNLHFKSDGRLSRCNNCTEVNQMYCCERCKKLLNNYEYFLSSRKTCDKCRTKIWKEQGLLND